MRAIIAAMVAMALIPAANAAVWTAACTGQRQIQYVQTLNGDGYLHFAQSDGTFTSIKLKQSFYNLKMVCGTTGGKAAPNQIGAICADSDDQTIRIVYGSQLAKGQRPEKAPVYCQAVVSISD